MSGTQLMRVKIMASVGKRRALLHYCTLVAMMLVLSAPARAADGAMSQLEDVTFLALPGNRVQVELTLSGPVPEPSNFATDTPARIALDFPGTTSNLAKKTHPVGIGAVTGIAAVQGKGRTRVVVDLVKKVPYQTRIEGNRFYITIESGEAVAASAGAPSLGGVGAAPPALGMPAFRINNVDFRRGEKGEARIIVSLSDPATPVNVREQGGKLLLNFAGTALPKELERRLDVVDFATPVSMVDAFTLGHDARLVISVSGIYEHLAYQTDRQFTLEVKPVSKAAQEQKKKEEQGYTGEKLSLNFQDIEVRAALQIIADFTGLNIVVSDTVQGAISLRLKDVPWDQAMDIILRSKALAMRKNGNVILVAPGAEIAAREKEDLESQKQITELEPLRSELVQVNYAKASDFAVLIRSKESSLLSERGNVTVDERTNSLLIQDTAVRLGEIRKVVTELDIPVRQVLIESRIVIANDDYSRELGVRFGATSIQKNGDSGVVSLTGSAAGNDTVVGSAINNLATTGQAFPVTAPSLTDRLGVNLPVASPAGRIGLALLGRDYLVDLELSALQAEGRGEVVSNPRLITANQKEAFIEQGVEIPYQEASSSGATTVAFKKAVLSLKVTPQITPDDRVIMDLRVNKDEPDFTRTVLGVPPLNTREIHTQVLVENGETVVLGGIYEQTRNKAVNKVPLLGDLPVLGALFRSTRNIDNKVELLIFVTPKILKESLGGR